MFIIKFLQKLEHFSEGGKALTVLHLEMTS